MKGTAMAKDFDDLLAKMSSERRAEIARLVEKIHSSPRYRIGEGAVARGGRRGGASARRAATPRRARPARRGSSSGATCGAGSIPPPAPPALPRSPPRHRRANRLPSSPFDHPPAFARSCHEAVCAMPCAPPPGRARPGARDTDASVDGTLALKMEGNAKRRIHFHAAWESGARVARWRGAEILPPAFCAPTPEIHTP